MAYNFASASSQYIRLVGSHTGLVDFTANHPMAMSAWINPTTLKADADITGKGFDGGSSAAYEMKLDSVSTKLFVGSYNGALHGVSATHGLSAGVWSHVSGDYDGSAWHAFANGSLIGTSVDAVGPRDNNEQVGIGAQMLAGATQSNYFNGAIAEVGIWNRALSLGEVAALARGYSPSLIRDGLVMWAPLVRDLLNPIGDVYTFSLSGSPPTVVPHPPVIKQRARKSWNVAAPPPPPAPPTTLFAQACM